MLTFLLLAACSGGPSKDAVPVDATIIEADPRRPLPAGDGPIIAVSVPLSGANAALGEAAIEGVRLAVPPGLGVWGIDENVGDPIPTALAEPRVVGVVAHVTEVGAERWAAGWAGTDLPVVVAAPAAVAGIPRVLAGGERHLRCASAWMQGKALLTHDGSMESMAVSNSVDAVLGRASLGVRALDPRQMATEAGHVHNARPSVVVFAGEATAAGNLLRALRQSQDQTPFVGLGVYDPRFLQAAGSAAEGALVTSQDRPAVDTEVLDRWRDKRGGDPPAVALNAYDAARLLVEAWATAVVPSKAEQRGAIKARLPQVEVEGAAGRFHLDDDLVATPAWCTAFEVQGGSLIFHEVARVVDSRVERVDLAAERAALAEERRLAEEARLAAEAAAAEAAAAEAAAAEAAAAGAAAAEAAAAGAAAAGTSATP